MTSLIPSNVSWLAQLSIAEASLSGSYAVLGQFTAPVVEMFFISTLDGPVQISFDGGTTAHLVIPEGDLSPVFARIDYKANRGVQQNPVVAAKTLTSLSKGVLYVCAYTTALT